MEKPEGITDFSLIGGPLHRLGCRLGLVRGGSNSVALGLALGVFLWAVLVTLVLTGGGPPVSSLSVIGAHVRLLVVIPLLFVCESAFDPRAATFVRGLVSSKIVPPDALQALEARIARTARWRDSWLPELVCLVAAGLLSLAAPRLPLWGATAAHDPSRAVSEMTWAGLWYWTVCLTLFRFLLLRWLWRLGLWCWFLWRVSRLDLHLVPTHPDGAGGLGYLEVVHTHLDPLVLAISAVQAASFAEGLSSGTMAFAEVYPALALVLVLEAALVIGPLFIFSPGLWACRVKGLSDYMEFAATYVGGFERKWLGAGAPPGEPLLGTPDLQSLADLNNSVTVVRNMRVVPVSPRMLRGFAMAALLPFLPLALLKYPVAELARRFFERLSGL